MAAVRLPTPYVLFFKEPPPMDCRGRDYALFRVRTAVILSPGARLGTARASACGGAGRGTIPKYGRDLFAAVQD